MTRRPGKGTVSAQVWEIAEALSRDLGRMALRREVVAEAVSQGVYEKTASTQYGAWKRAYHPDAPHQGGGMSAVPGPANARIVQASQAPEKDPDRDWSILLRAGFSYLADFQLGPEGQPVLDAEAPAEPGVYVLIRGEEVVYVGVTQRTLRRRMADYRRGSPGQRTSAFVHAQVKQSLSGGHRVRLLCATPEPSEWNGLPVVTAAGLELGLIRQFRPVWNRQGVRG